MEPLPDGNYTREIPKLNQHANVRTVGYVSTSYTTRNISLALRDIDIYSAWAENSTVSGLGMHGIFLDETPSQYQPASVQFLDTLAASIKSQTGLGKDPLVSVGIFVFSKSSVCSDLGNIIKAWIKQQALPRTSKRHSPLLQAEPILTQKQIIHNPGTIPDPRYMTSANLTVVFEGTYSTYQIYGFHKAMTTFQDSSKTDRNALAAIVHTVPTTLSDKDEKSLVRDLRSSVGNIFITGLSVDYYASFWSGWLGFTDDMVS